MTVECRLPIDSSAKPGEFHCVNAPFFSHLSFNLFSLVPVNGPRFISIQLNARGGPAHGSFHHNAAGI